MMWISGTVAVAVLIVLVVCYNRLVRDKHRTASGWSDIEVQLKRRHDLIPKLIAAVKHYASYEQATLERVTALREAALTQSSATGEAALIGGLLNIYALSEDYPELKSDQSYLQLQQEISAVESDIQFARRYYNGAVNHYNTRIETFPDLIVARILNFKPGSYFEFEGSL